VTQLTRAWIVSSSPVLRAGIAALIADRIEIAGLGDRLPDAAQGTVDVIVLDWSAAHRGDLPDTAVPILAISDDPQPSWMRDALRDGVRGIIARDLAADEFVAAVHAVAAGFIVLPPEMREAILSATTAAAPQDDPLSPREIEVLRLVAEGSSNKTIAWKLQISEHTVKFHVNSILSKMGAGSRTEAVMLGLRRGLIPL
jgi:NarL family two-component system response regulator YdfI